MPFSRHTRRSVFSIGAASLAAAFLFLTPENTHAADTTAKIHILTLGSGSNAIVLESVDDNGQKIFGMVDSGEDWDYPDGSDPRYPLRSGITTSTGYDDEVLSYLDSLGVTSDNLQFYVATHPHSDHIGTGDTIVRLYSPDRVYLLPYDDSYIYNTARLWDNLYVYDQLLTAAEETEGVTLIQHLNPGAASAEEGSPDFAFGNFQIQIVNYEEDYLTSPKEDANQFCLGVIASANDHRAFLTSDIDDVEGDASRIVSNYGLYSIDLMTSNHHGYPNAVDADYLAAVNPEYFIQTGDFRIMDNDTVETLTSLGLRVFSTTEYSGDLPAVIADFSGSAVTSNVDDTYEIYRGRSSKLVAYHDGIPYSGFFTRGGQKYYADSSHLLVCSTSWRDTETGIEYTSDENGVITNERHVIGWVNGMENGITTTMMKHRIPAGSPSTTKRITSARTALWQQAGFCLMEITIIFPAAVRCRPDGSLSATTGTISPRIPVLCIRPDGTLIRRPKRCTIFTHGEVPHAIRHLP